MRLYQSSWHWLTRLLAVVFAVSLLAGCGGSNSSSDGGVDQLPLTSPKTVSVTGKDGSLLLYWTKLAAIQGTEASYEVFYNTTDDFKTATKVTTPASVAGMLVSLSIDSLTNGQLYYIYVRASYGSLGQASTSAAFTGMPVAAPATPSITASSGWDGVLEVVWDKPQYAASYKVYWYKAGNTDAPHKDAKVSTVAGERTLITGVDNATSYRVWVKALNTAGESGYAFADVSASAVTAAPAAPNVGTVKAGGSKQLLVTFDAVAQASGYKVRYATSNDLSSATEITIAPQSGTVVATVPALVNGTTYSVWVSATNSQGASAFTFMSTGTPVAGASIDYQNPNFSLGVATADFIWAEQVPASAFFPTSAQNPAGGRYSDRLSRFRETAIGNLFTDGAGWYVRDKYPDEKIDFVFLNGGFIEGPIPQGNIRLGDIYNIVSGADAAEDKLVILTLSGSEVIKLFRTSAAINHTGRGSKNTGGWGIVSKEVNFTVRYKTLDKSLYPDDGSNPVPKADTPLYQNGWIENGSLKLNGQDISADKSYRIATTSYLADGNEGYLPFLKATDRANYPEYFWQAVAHYIYEMGSVTPATDGRIQLIGGVPLAPPGWSAGDLNWEPPYDNTTINQ